VCDAGLRLANASDRPVREPTFSHHRPTCSLLRCPINPVCRTSEDTPCTELKHCSRSHVRFDVFSGQDGTPHKSSCSSNDSRTLPDDMHARSAWGRYTYSPNLASRTFDSMFSDSRQHGRSICLASRSVCPSTFICLTSKPGYHKQLAISIPSPL
jgi:hypothetical protein